MNATVYRVRVEREIAPTAAELVSHLERRAQFVDVRAFSPEEARGSALDIVRRSKSWPAGRDDLIAVNVAPLES